MAAAFPRARQCSRRIDQLRGEYMQTPPAYSAKKVGGRRAYDFARDERRSC